MDAVDIKDRINELCSAFTFTYKGKNCGVDPLSYSCFNMWYGDDLRTVDNIERVMDFPLFDGRSLQDISGEINDVDY